MKNKEKINKFDTYTIKCVINNNGFYLGQTYAPKIKNAIQYAIDNYKNTVFSDYKIIGIAYGFETDINSKNFRDVINGKVI